MSSISRLKKTHSKVSSDKKKVTKNILPQLTTLLALEQNDGTYQIRFKF
jgi:hypothetical protein